MPPQGWLYTDPGAQEAPEFVILRVLSSWEEGPDGSRLILKSKSSVSGGSQIVLCLSGNWKQPLHFCVANNTKGIQLSAEKEASFHTERGRQEERPGSLSGLSCIYHLAFSETFLPSRETPRSLTLLLGLSQVLSAN